MSEEARIRPARRYPLSKKEKRRLQQEIGGLAQIPREAVLEIAEFKEGYSIIAVDGVPCIVKVQNMVIPHLLCLLRNKIQFNLPRVIVDRGATKAIARGATLMVPGIKFIEGEFSSGSTVIIVDEEAGVPVAVGEALMSSREIRERLESERRGRAIKIVHRPGDKFWKAGESL